MKANKKAFTLIELIIVMAIIGILSVVAIVALGGKGAEARNTKRLADMRAIILAMALECQDNGSLLSCSQNLSSTPGHPFDILSSCQDPGDYTKLSIATDPKSDDPNFSGVCDLQAMQSGKGCGYSLRLTSDAAPFSYSPCDPHIIFAIEGDVMTYGCAENQGTTQGITSPDQCI